LVSFAQSVPPVVLLGAFILLLLLLMLGGILLVFLYGPQVRRKRRFAAVVGNGSGGGDGVLQRTGQKSKDNRRRDTESKLKEAEMLRQKKRGYRLREEMIQAGIKMSVGKFAVVSFIIGTLLTVLYAFSGMLMVGIPLVWIIGVLGLPKFFLRFRIKRRLQRFGSVFPDGIDIIVRGVRTGLTVGESLSIVGRELPDPAGEEFRLLTEGLQLGLTLEECMNRMVARVPVTEVRFFGIVLVTQQATGGNLAETLAKLSDVLRSRKKMREKVKAMSSEAKASAGIIGSLPIAVGGILSFVAPDYISLLFTRDAGNWLLAIAVVSMSIGIFVMKRMIAFEL